MGREIEGVQTKANGTAKAEASLLIRERERGIPRDPVDLKLEREGVRERVKT